MCAIIAGAEGWEDIEDFGKTYLDWLQKKGLFPTGLPVDDTIARIISRLDPTQFQPCFIQWVQVVNDRTEGEIIAIDGKRLRGFYDRNTRNLVSSCEVGIVNTGISCQQRRKCHPGKRTWMH
ncbi:Predicted transposase YbfD/YdcC associated with H repeats [Xenorhabdus japonica]|uniref:Predicted transposase YbfD/YdcC associated with H repeats n=1 Tax=Xenorhabdus japonica TaxID=53341 RepID=A0A1I5EJ62_9GAMM|nr:Predicted transposase YbfD/YdcC associated with H repeats [Xenorhabdus japonica]